MARYKLILAYDGTAYSGSQRQARQRTVQAELEHALRSLGWRGPGVVLAGRTDSGVHAAGQVAALDFVWAHSPDELRDALNAKLPLDIAVRGVEIAAADFHPRFDAASRRYRYQLWCGRIRDPLRERIAWRVWPPVELAVLVRTAHLFRGTHDFAAFGSAPRKGGGTVRTVTVSEWTQAGEDWWLDVAADGFLYRMVRRLVYVQVAVAHERCSAEAVVGALAGGQRTAGLPAGLAPACGLTLVGVDY